uniref:IncF plasmid conjugative transfer protein TraN n=1 Tax=Klebsiella pneumoniae TaxID=573 RepID=A0A8B0ST41_KLEPN|nr:IncF plasmid conjugative transfer protein TraN [Klebsiella pneumoniae]
MWQRVTEPLTSAYESIAGNVSRLIGSSTVEGGRFSCYNRAHQRWVTDRRSRCNKTAVDE